MENTVLNIAAGKFQPLVHDMDKARFLVNLDTMYYSYTAPAAIEQEYQNWTKTVDKKFACNEDAFAFMERTQMTFSDVCIYRFLEHVSFAQLNYFIYLLSTITEPGSIVDVIVPNYEVLAKLILEDDPADINFEAKNILLTTELLNEPSCPHASIWTPERAHFFFELEGRFQVVDIDDRFEFDGRDIYLRFFAVRL